MAMLELFKLRYEAPRLNNVVTPTYEKYMQLCEESPLRAAIVNKFLL